MTYARFSSARRGVAAFAFTAVTLLGAGVANAQTTAPTAAQVREGHTLFEQGYAAFQALDYASALPLFQRAFVLTRDPVMLYNIAATLEHLGRNSEAATALRRYLAAVPNAANRTEAEAHIVELEAQGPSASPAPIASPEPVASSSPPPESHITPEGPPRRPLWPFGVIGAGVLVAIGGGVTIALAGDPGLGQPYANERDYLRAADQASTQRLVGGVVLGVGAAAVVIGAIVAATNRPRGSRTSFTWDVSPSREGAMVQLGVRGFGL